MKSSLENLPSILPPSLDVDETELAARNRILTERDKPNSNDFDDFTDPVGGETIVLDESDQAPGGASDELEAKNERRAKRRKSVLFVVIFAAVLGLFVLAMSWFLGFGFFAETKRVAVDRSKSANGASLMPAASEDEKLKTALAMVATTSNNTTNPPAVSGAPVDANAFEQQNANPPASEPPVDLSSKTGESVSTAANNPTGNMVVLPEQSEPTKIDSKSQTTSARPFSPSGSGAQNSSFGSSAASNSPSVQSQSTDANNETASKSGGAVARSIFFGRAPKQNDSANNLSSTRFAQASARPIAFEQPNVPAFGALLPVRFLGAVYTLRGTSGLVRMELTRAIANENFAYPAGTVIVGSLRGADYNRAFVSVVGAIDPETKKLVKFSGELLGADGASGVAGERKTMKSWGARFLAGLRTAGGQAVNVLAARRGGGTIVVDGAGGALGGEAANIIRGDKTDDSFVMIKAGTEGYVLITDLPAEQRENDAPLLQRATNEAAGNSEAAQILPGVNLSQAEMAEILTTDDADKIRAALVQMSPEFRALAINAMRANQR